jgi:type IX secretion system PorP/SprF family membrane protein
MKHYLSLLLIALLVNYYGSAQSYHFSQFFSTPLLTNPAQTGVIDGAYRLASNFRAQGLSGGSPYLTGYISADISPFKTRLLTGHKAGVGLYIMNDQSLGGALKQNSVGASAAYNVGLDADGIHSLGVGFQGVYHQRVLDYSKLRFNSQFQNETFNGSIPIGETFDYYKKNYFDANAGILYKAEGENGGAFAGIAVYNILKHEENMFSDEFQMPTRFTFQGGTQLYYGTATTLYLSLTYMQQAKASQTTLGAAYGYQLTEGERNEVTFGMWYRFKDALIPYIGYHKNGLQLGLTYDYTTSTKKTGAEIRHGFELTLMYSIPDKSELKKLVPWY